MIDVEHKGEKMLIFTLIGLGAFALLIVILVKMNKDAKKHERIHRKVKTGQELADELETKLREELGMNKEK